MLNGISPTKNVKKYQPMKPTRFLLFISTLLIFSFTGCKEDNYEDWKIVNDQWMLKHQSDSGFVVTSSGLCYQIIHQSVGRKPNASSWITANYKGYLIDGTLFEEGQYDYYLSSSISGWQEGITKMRDGSTFIFYIPSSLAYGKDGSGSTIPPYSALIYEVTLVSSYY
ncbi:MAG TPA: FKBP-type peptidyl-prolyl cis-trans isomerase [Paludibacteraceae bacterium]|jgi:FKBP-type peptidyl-prolyl cis-trans isomerase|nr:FKBP-type peptidyl-prolyl cis-trans isomerase [Paludibacteraceae bacterium]HNZ61338.1 FKBP-type peptidyl-prolyl cis-trans isomerase [Paludibacteraceae bacterium]HOH55301.1 FKBP-type peptidyl-prolyl cis-trans isomerase [Paludibacteraceae bacterium]